jgi:hypothetical protein
MKIEIIQMFRLSIGDLYSIRFPVNFVPNTGLIFSNNNSMWKITGVAASSSPNNSILKNHLTENIWDCRIEAMDSITKELEMGSIEVSVIDSPLE